VFKVKGLGYRVQGCEFGVESGECRVLGVRG